MGFDSKAFMRAQFTPRTEDVRLPGLSEWFGDDDPVWTVRGLTANEIARTNEAEIRNKRIGSIASVIEALSESGQVGELRDSLGLNDATHAEVAKRMEQLVIASVNPVITLDVAVKLANNYPVEFYQISHVIVELTGQGSLAEKKPQRSGKKPE